MVPDWELFFLGGVVLGRPAERHENLFRAPIAQTHAYGIHRRAFAAVERSYAPIDLFYADNLKSYCAYPMLAWQRDGFSDVEGVSTSRAYEANRAYKANRAYFLLNSAPQHEDVLRDFLLRRFRGRLIRLRSQRRLGQSLRRLASLLGFMRGRSQVNRPITKDEVVRKI